MRRKVNKKIVLLILVTLEYFATLSGNLSGLKCHEGMQGDLIHSLIQSSHNYTTLASVLQTAALSPASLTPALHIPVRLFLPCTVRHSYQSLTFTCLITIGLVLVLTRGMSIGSLHTDCMQTRLGTRELIRCSRWLCRTSMRRARRRRCCFGL
jgi:hypothetical protein